MSYCSAQNATTPPSFDSVRIIWSDTSINFAPSDSHVPRLLHRMEPNKKQHTTNFGSATEFSSAERNSIYLSDSDWSSITLGYWREFPPRHHPSNRRHTCRRPVIMMLMIEVIHFNSGRKREDWILSSSSVVSKRRVRRIRRWRSRRD